MLTSSSFGRELIVVGPEVDSEVELHCGEGESSELFWTSGSVVKDREEEWFLLGMVGIFNREIFEEIEADSTGSGAMSVVIVVCCWNVGGQISIYRSTNGKSQHPGLASRMQVVIN